MSPSPGLFDGGMASTGHITGENWRGAAWNGNSTTIILLGKRGERENRRHVGRERERRDGQHAGRERERRGRGGAVRLEAESRDTHTQAHPLRPIRSRSVSETTLEWRLTQQIAGFTAIPRHSIRKLVILSCTIDVLPVKLPVVAIPLTQKARA